MIGGNRKIQWDAITECHQGSRAFYALILFIHLAHILILADLADGNCAGAAKRGDYFYQLELLLMAERPTLIAIRAGEYVASIVSGAGTLSQCRGLHGDVTAIVVY